MSTFAVFGMTRDYALAEARKKTPITITERTPKGSVTRDLTPAEWEQACHDYVDKLMQGTRCSQLCKPYDAPQFAAELIDLMRARGGVRDLCIKARTPDRDGQGALIRHKKTGAPVMSWKPWV